MVVTLTRSTVSAPTRKEGIPPNPPQSEDLGDNKTQYKSEIVILVSAPLIAEDFSPVEGLSVQQEIDEIVAVIEEIEANVAIEIIVKIATTESLLQVFAMSSRPIIIHFIGHGMQTDQGIALLLEDAVGKAKPFTSQDLNDLLAERPYPPCELALLNACHSEGLANSLITAGVPHIIAINAEDTILDVAARSFAKNFYQALFNTYSIINAFYHSRSAVKVNDDLKKLFNPKTWQQGINLEEALKFQLLPSTSQAHHQPLNLETGDRKVIITPSWEKTNLPSHDVTFVGRRLAIYEIVVELANYSKGHCIVLHGMGGMGKTALALAVGRWQHERKLWRDGVWFIKLRGIDSVVKAISILTLTLSLELAYMSCESLSQALRNQEVLLILDDLDQLLEDDADELVKLINSLLKCRKLGLLVTAREDLPMAEIPVRPMEVQEMNYGETKQAFSNYAPPQEQWDLDDLSQDDFEALIKFFDGYPFAIRLAATYIKETRCSLRMLCEALKLDPCETLKPISRKESRDNSLVATLEISYQVLPPGAREIFALLSFFHGGLTTDLASFITGRNSFGDLATLLAYSMAEKPETTSEYRIILPEPARRYAEGKQGQGLENYAPNILQYFYDFSKRVYDLLTEEPESSKGKQLLLDESTNLNYFLSWAYENESNSENICHSARITALLARYWHWVVPGETALSSLEKSLVAARRNQDMVGQADIYKAIGDIQSSARGLEVAEKLYEQSIELYKSACESLSELLEIASIREKIGGIWNICQKLDSAIVSYIKAYKIYSSKEKIVEAARTQIIIGQTYKTADNLELALVSYKKARQLYTTQNYQPGIAKVDFLIRQLSTDNDLKLESFSFTTVTVNEQGNVVKEETYSGMHFLESLPNQILIEMIAIPGGEFMMGSPEEEEGYSDELPQHLVTLSNFYMGKYPVTQAQWKAVSDLPKIEQKLDADPSRFKGDDFPVERVSWYSAVEFCKRLSKYSGRDYRLPSEAQWEYACRAKTVTPFHFGDTLTSDLANYNAITSYGSGPTGEYRRKTVDTRSFPANPFGLYDIHGNVWEWCQDAWHENYNGAPVNGSAWTQESDLSYRVLRGGSWFDLPGNCRSACRGYNTPNIYDYDFGFRVVCLSQIS